MSLSPSVPTSSHRDRDRPHVDRLRGSIVSAAEAGYYGKGDRRQNMRARVR